MLLLINFQYKAHCVGTILYTSLSNTAIGILNKSTKHFLIELLPLNTIVIYSTHRGNTEKVAEAIAQAAGGKAIKLTENFDPKTLPLEGIDTVFLGTGIRGGEPYVELLNYLKAADLGTGKRFLLFMTWAGGGASNKLAYECVKNALEVRGQHLEPDVFICLGQTFGFTHRGHPNEGDLADAKKWATGKLG
jgi:flavodoxin